MLCVRNITDYVKYRYRLIYPVTTLVTIITSTTNTTAVALRSDTSRLHTHTPSAEPIENSVMCVLQSFMQTTEFSNGCVLFAETAGRCVGLTQPSTCHYRRVAELAKRSCILVSLL